MSTIVTNVDEIKMIINQAVKEVIQSVLPGLVKEANAKPWLTKSELKKKTGWSDRRIQYLRESKQIPFSQTGRSVLYDNQGVEAFLRAHQIKVRDRS